MSRYRKLLVNVWDQEPYLDGDDLTRSVWLMLLCGPVTSNVPGIMCATPATVADALRRDVAEVRRVMLAFVDRGLIELDERARLVRVPGAPAMLAETGEPHNPNVVKGWAATWRLFPECDLKARHLATLWTEMVSRSAPRTQEAWVACFGEPKRNGFGTVAATVPGTVPGTNAERLPQPFAEPFDDGSNASDYADLNGSGTVPHTVTETVPKTGSGTGSGTGSSSSARARARTTGESSGEDPDPSDPAAAIRAALLRYPPPLCWLADRHAEERFAARVIAGAVPVESVLEAIGVAASSLSDLGDTARDNDQGMRLVERHVGHYVGNAGVLRRNRRAAAQSGPAEGVTLAAAPELLQQAAALWGRLYVESGYAGYPRGTDHERHLDAVLTYAGNQSAGDPERAWVIFDHVVRAYLEDGYFKRHHHALQFLVLTLQREPARFGLPSSAGAAPMPIDEPEMRGPIKPPAEIRDRLAEVLSGSVGKTLPGSGRRPTMEDFDG